MKCAYCGTFEANIEIPSPNGFEDGYWKVCSYCEKMIELQKELSFIMLMKVMKMDVGKEILEKQEKEVQMKIVEIERQSGVPSYSAIIIKKEDEK